MDTSSQTPEAALDDLFASSTPEPEAQETETTETATTGEQTAEGEAQSQEGQQATAQAQQQAIFAEVAGRKYSSKEDFIKSHETLLEKSRRQYEEAQAWKTTHDRWGKWDKLMSENPDFHRQVQEAERRFMAAKAAGATNAQARQAANAPQTLPPEIMEKLKTVDQLQQFVQEQQQERENTALKNELDATKAKFKLDDPTMKRVTEVMLEVATKTGLSVSAEWAYRDLRNREANEKLLQAKTELKRVKGADTSPAAPNAPPAKRKNGQFMSKAEEDAAAAAWVDSLGIGEGE